MGDMIEAIRELAGAHVRIAWAQQQQEHDDFVGVKPDFRLMVLGTDDDRGERAVFDKVGSYCAPMITPKGDRIVYSDTADFTAHVVGWDGTGHRVLGPGFAVGVWGDARTGEEWVFIRPETEASWNSKSRGVMKHLIDDPSVCSMVWDKSSISRNWFQLSGDGTRAAVAAPWPKCGFITLPNGEFTQIDSGCWTAMTPDNTYRMWVFDKDHRHVKIYDRSGSLLSRVDLHAADGINGYEVYHPRLANDGRIVTMTGPYSKGSAEPCPPDDRENRIKIGGKNIELYVGRLDESLGRIEKWVRVTSNDKADFFGDAWVAKENGPANSRS